MRGLEPAWCQRDLHAPASSRYSLLPLALIACALASAPWLRAFPSAVIAVPLFGAALLSVLAPVFVVGIGVRRLWLSRADRRRCCSSSTSCSSRCASPAGFDDLYTGLVHGPSQMLTFALPLVSPRTLLVAPVALCWLGGAIVGECIGRGWQTVLPYVTLLVAFGLSYAGIGPRRHQLGRRPALRHPARRRRCCSRCCCCAPRRPGWRRTRRRGDPARRPAAAARAGDRRRAVGWWSSLAARRASRSRRRSPGRRGTPARTPPLDRTQPLTPLSFVAGLRPADPTAPGPGAVHGDHRPRPARTTCPSPSVDYYDGDGWSFDADVPPVRRRRPRRRPTPRCARTAAPVTQQYTIGTGALTSTPWMPYLYRPSEGHAARRSTSTRQRHDRARATRCTPARATPCARTSPTTPFSTAEGDRDRRPASAQPSTRSCRPAAVEDRARHAGRPRWRSETGVVERPAPIPFLQAVASDFRTNFGARRRRRRPRRRHAASGASRRIARGVEARRASAPPASAVVHTGGRAARAGGTSFADVLASIRQFRSATPGAVRDADVPRRPHSWACPPGSSPGSGSRRRRAPRRCRPASTR